ncbi:MAG: GNAT family N-acetyltransferase, partial [Syntrophaceae bacterium]|nr:GNAT family N-acetyltransferase [Syntrophaceae bacterium]
MLARWYEWHMEPPNECYAFGAFDEESMRGFCLAGVFLNSEVYFFRENILFVLWELITHPLLILNKKTLERLKNIVLAFYEKLSSRTRKVQKSARPRSEKFGILSIAVDPVYQKLGIGRSLVNRVEELAVEKGIKKINISVHPTNVLAVRFYEKNGWQRVCYDSSKPWQGYMIKV